MENASKALIIAGAILISILLISVGIMVMNSANSLVDEGASTMDQQAIQAFNAPFIQYAGVQRGSTVRSLMQSVISSNGTRDQKITVSGIGSTPEAVISAVSSSRKYTVNITTDTQGLVTGIEITEGATSGGSSGGTSTGTGTASSN